MKRFGSTKISWLTTALVTVLPRCNLEHLVVKYKDGRPKRTSWWCTDSVYVEVVHCWEVSNFMECQVLSAFSYIGFILGCVIQHPTFYRPDALPVTQLPVSKHWRESSNFHYISVDIWQSYRGKCFFG